LDGFIDLELAQFELATKSHTTLLSTLPAICGSGPDQRSLELGNPA
jgi:hypothetical protein